ncbi:hypothetical protein GN956_G11168 [Arapaima gigas]
MLTSLQLRLQWKILAPQPDRAELETREKKRAAIRRRPGVKCTLRRRQQKPPLRGVQSCRRRQSSQAAVRNKLGDFGLPEE